MCLQELPLLESELDVQPDLSGHLCCESKKPLDLKQKVCGRQRGEFQGCLVSYVIGDALRMYSVYEKPWFEGYGVTQLWRCQRASGSPAKSRQMQPGVYCTHKH